MKKLRATNSKFKAKINNKNHRVACVGKDFKIIQFQLLAMGSGCPGGDTAEVTDVTMKQQSMMDTFQYLSEM